jgi:hypothetical protein
MVNYWDRNVPKPPKKKRKTKELIRLRRALTFRGLKGGTA